MIWSTPILRFVIDQVATAVIKADWSKVKQWVIDLEANDLISGSEKRQIVINGLREAGCVLAGYLLDFAIGAALVWARQQQEKE